MPNSSYPGIYVEEISTDARVITSLSIQKSCSPVQQEALLEMIERKKKGFNVLAVFAGDDRTGKLKVVRALAKELNADLYRIDLSAVVSKYIGETEKNLRKLFDAAEEGGAILFFDEADALFGKRTEVKDSHDRYANVEINYLLQRMESYKGIAILASNVKSNLDSAFLRRLRFVVSFPFRTKPTRKPPGKRRTRKIS